MNRINDKIYILIDRTNQYRDKLIDKQLLDGRINKVKKQRRKERKMRDTINKY